MVTSRQIRAARALLGWTQERLADHALVALTALKRLESGHLGVRDETREAVRKALEGNGILFLASARGIGVMLVQPVGEPLAADKEKQPKQRKRKSENSA